MAIDSAEKRASIQAYSGRDSALCARLDGVALLNAADRSHVSCRYRGIAAGLAVPLVTGPGYATAGQIWIGGSMAGQIVQT